MKNKINDKLQVTTVYLPKLYIIYINQLIKNGIIGSRSEFIRIAVYKSLVEHLTLVNNICKEADPDILEQFKDDKKIMIERNKRNKKQYHEIKMETLPDSVLSSLYGRGIINKDLKYRGKDE